MIARTIKRGIDILVAATGLIVFSIPMLLVAVAIGLVMGRPVLFRQVRPGKNAEPFSLYKFRTMREVCDVQGRPLPDGQRLTGLGRWLRKTSLDELPQLWNVLKGEMSLVGPRPLLTRYLPYYRQRERLRFTVRPGITGWAQVHGRNVLGWDQRLDLDAWYVENWSLGLDVRILARTFLSVLTHRGVMVDPRATGNKDLDEERMSLVESLAHEDSAC